MIKIPEEILTVAELTEATGRKAQDIDIEITGLSVDRSSLVLSIDTKLNFVLPRNLESVMKERIRAKLGSVHKIRVNYMYSGIKVAPPPADYDQGSQSGGYNGGGYNGSNGGGGGGYRRKAKEEPAHENARGELILLGKDFTDVPTDFKDLENYVGAKDKVCIEGEVFSIESMPIRNGKILITILIAAKVRTFCIKSFISSEKFAEIDENLSTGDMIRARGPIEYDTYEHENLMMANALKKVAKTFKEDTYPNGRRVELHCHSKMSDNDGFNEVADIVNSAAYWGQPAVAITDHGVVQGFPDAAKAAGKLAKAGKNIKIIYGVEGYLYPDEDAWLEDGTLDIKKNRTYHIILLAKNQEGIKNIYKLVSLSHIDYFYKRPRLPRSVLQAHREGLIIGSACEAGELYQAVEHGASDEELDRIASFYDYLEIQPLGNNQFMVNEGRVGSVDDLIAFNRKIIEIGDRLGKLTVATTDSHYPTREASIYRNIIMAGIGFRDTPSDSLYLRTTDEMIREFDYLGDRAEEIVVTNTNKIADMVEDVLPVPNKIDIRRSASTGDRGQTRN